MPVSKVSLSELDITVTIAQGRNLIAKDRALLSRKRTSSDPYVKVFLGRSSPTMLVGATSVIPKNCENPVWNATLRKSFRSATEVRQLMSPATQVWCVIYDSDGVSADDPMGVVSFPFLATDSQEEFKWYAVTPGPSGSSIHCHNATGELQVQVQVQGRPVRDLARGAQLAVQPNQHTAALRVGLAWDIQPGVGAVDLDSAVVAVDRNGQVDMRQTVYYGNLSNPNRSVTHSGDDTTGDGGGDDETILINLRQIPSHIIALYLLLTVATPGKTLGQVTSAVIQAVDCTNNKVICRSVPAESSRQENTALVLMRMSQTTTNGGWLFTPIQEGFSPARDCKYWAGLIEAVSFQICNQL